MALEKIRSLRPEFASLPSQAYLCALHGLPSAPNLKDKMSELTGNGEDSLWLRVMSVKDGKCQVILDTAEDRRDASDSINARISTFLPTPAPGTGNRPSFAASAVAGGMSSAPAPSEETIVDQETVQQQQLQSQQQQQQPEVTSFRPAPAPLPTHEFASQASLENSAEELFVTFVNSPSEFYIQLSRDNDAIDAMMGELEALVALVRPTPFAALAKGMPISAKYAEDDNW